MRYRLHTLLILLAAAPPLLAVDGKPMSAAIDVGRPIAEVTTILGERKIKWTPGGWAETGGDPDSAEVDFDLDQEMIARVFYSKSRKIVDGISIVVSPKGQGRSARSHFPAKRIVLEDDGSISVQFLPKPISKPVPELKPEFPRDNPRGRQR
jgi:hypothetical protein